MKVTAIYSHDGSKALIDSSQQDPFDYIDCVTTNVITCNEADLGFCMECNAPATEDCLYH